MLSLWDTDLPKRHWDLLGKAEKELLSLEPAFADFLKRIRVEKPDVLVFLDKGARVFGVPFLKYLKQLERTGGIEKAPEIRFYNDHDLKEGGAEGCMSRDEIKQRLSQDFSWIGNQKVFFVDETIASGGGLGIINRMSSVIDNQNIWYFAFSRLHCNILWSYWNDSDVKVIVYPLVSEYLFSRIVAFDFFDDKWNGERTMTNVPAQTKAFHEIYVSLHDRILDALERADAPNRISKAAE